MAYPKVSWGRQPAGRLLLLPLVAALFVVVGCTQSRSAATQDWSGAAPSDGFVYVGTKDGRIVQLDAATGASRATPFQAKASNGGFAAFYGTPTVANGTLYAGGYQGIVYAMDAKTLGNVRTFEIGGNPLTKGIAGQVVPADGVVVVGAAEDASAGRIYVLDANSLNEICQYPAKGQPPVGRIWSTPAVADGVIYVGDLAHHLYAVSLKDCSLVWSSPADLNGAVVAPPFVAGNYVYVGGFDRNFYSVNRQTGQAEKLFSADNWFWGGVASDGTRLFIPNLSGTLYAYDLQEHRVVWTYPPPGQQRSPILSAPVVYGNNVVMGSDAGTVVVLRASDGKFEWDQQVQGGSIRAPLTIQGNILFVTTVNGMVTAINLDTKAQVWQHSLSGG